MNDQQIIEKLGLQNLPKEVQDQTVESVNQVVELRVMGMIDEMMSDEQRATFESKSQESPEAVWKWISQEFTDVSKLYDAALQDYLDEKTAQK